MSGPQTPSYQNRQSPQTRRRGYFTFRHLTALAAAAALSAGGLVGVEDFAFVVFSLIYMHFLSKVAFPILSPNMGSPIFGQNKVMGPYIFIAALIGLILPVAYIIEGIFEGDKEGIKAAAPHIFLLSSQVFMEGVAFSDKFSLPISVFVPVFYNSRRIFTIVDWMRAEMLRLDELQSGSRWRLYVGNGLAIAIWLCGASICLVSCCLFICLEPLRSTILSSTRLKTREIYKQQSRHRSSRRRRKAASTYTVAIVVAHPSLPLTDVAAANRMKNF